ncbi:GntR family transcriptional regulator [uncultured Gimesia sp.]|uniref:GntR family transcriptional regulator n=1 Tax=uncultured Gimesia sp. TaxID=1678688 RepID=UPI00262BBFDD|nr:GntR family transcriptional regulator [uncultured Gimesia sp.]
MSKNSTTLMELNGQTVIEDDVSPSLVDEVYQKLLLRIIRSELPDGTELKSTQLAREIGVSRTPVVQALARLQADGIVIQQKNHRAVVREGAENWLVEIHELRVLLEPSAAAMAAQNIPETELVRLQSLAAEVKSCQQLYENGDQSSKHLQTWGAASRSFDYALHLTIAEHCGNLPISEAIHKCWSYKRVSYSAMGETPEIMTRGLYDHTLLLDSLKNRDSETASAAMTMHLRNAARMRPDRLIV